MDFTQGELVDFSVARLYWISSVCATGTALALLGFLAYQYLYNPLFTDWSLLSFLPTLVGDVLFSSVYGLHHGINLFRIKEDTFPDGMAGFSCHMTLLGTASMMMQILGLLALAWAPLYTIRCGQAFRPRNPKRYVASWTAGSLLFVLCETSAYGAVGETRTWRGLYCPGYPANLGEIILYLWWVPCWFLAFGYALVMSRVELSRLRKTAHVPGLERISVDVTKFAMVFTANFFLWNTTLMVQLFMIAFGFEEYITAGFAFVTGLLIKWNAIGDVFCVLYYSRHLNSARAHSLHTSSDLFFTNSVDVSAEDLDLLENRGVSNDFLAHFVRLNSISRRASTEKVMQRHIKPATAEACVPYVELAKRWVNSANQLAVGQPQFFVSHCWSDTFYALTEQLLCFTARESFNYIVYFWIDVFAVNQHKLDATTELARIPHVIQCSQALICTLNPWTGPKVLTRVWCLWELLQAVRSGKTIRPTMPQSEEFKFLETVRQDRSQVDLVLATIDVKKANATVAEDKEAIFDEISTSLGYDSMNKILKSSLKLCLQGVAIDRCFSSSLPLPDMGRFFGDPEKVVKETSRLVFEENNSLESEADVWMGTDGDTLALQTTTSAHRPNIQSLDEPESTPLRHQKEPDYRTAQRKLQFSRERPCSSTRSSSFVIGDNEISEGLSSKDGATSTSSRVTMTRPRPPILASINVSGLGEDLEGYISQRPPSRPNSLMAWSPADDSSLSPRSSIWDSGASPGLGLGGSSGSQYIISLDDVAMDIHVGESSEETTVRKVAYDSWDGRMLECL